MEETMVLIPDGSSLDDRTAGDIVMVRFKFKKVPESKIGAPDEPKATKPFSVNLKVSGTLLATGHWRELDELGKMRLYYRFIEEKLIEQGLPDSPASELDLNTFVPGAEKMPKNYVLPRIDLSKEIRVAPRPPGKIGFPKK
jgi:hypothetical protein